jgi:hypothetical protein
MHKKILKILWKFSLKSLRTGDNARDLVVDSDRGEKLGD